MSYELVLLPTAKKDIKNHQKSGNIKLLKKIMVLMDELQLHPRTGIGKPERLKHYGTREIYSRRIDREHRLVYEILEDDTIVILMTAFGHYQ